jgi:hypothetical protein
MSEAYWKKRYYAAEKAFHILKNYTKSVNASLWSDDYRELAGLIHSAGRDVFWLTRCGSCGKCDDCLQGEASRAEDKMSKRLLEAGMSEEEVTAFNLSVDAANAVLALPDLHPMDREEYCHAFHVIQNKLLSRPLMRVVRATESET